jgi:hypothetical protein
MIIRLYLGPFSAGKLKFKFPSLLCSQGAIGNLASMNQILSSRILKAEENVVEIGVILFP